MLEKLGAIIGIVAGLIAIWEGVARIVGSDGPVTIAQEISDGSNTTVPNLPTLDTTEKHLDTPSGVSLSGDCESGFTLTWEPVDGADTYRIERDGRYSGTERDTNHSIPTFPDEREHRYQVFAEAFPNSRSDGSAEVATEACSF